MIDITSEKINNLTKFFNLAQNKKKMRMYLLRSTCRYNNSTIIHSEFLKELMKVFRKYRRVNEN